MPRYRNSSGNRIRNAEGGGRKHCCCGSIPSIFCQDCAGVDEEETPNAPQFFHAIMPVVGDISGDGCFSFCTDMSNEVYDLEFGNDGGYSITGIECYWGFTDFSTRFVLLERVPSGWRFRANGGSSGCQVNLTRDEAEAPDCFDGFDLIDTFAPGCEISSPVQIVPGAAP